MGWLGGWYKRVKVTIDSGDIDAALTDFPVLVYLSTSSGLGPDDVSFIFDELGSDANRKKIAVTIDDGTTECYVEIDKWDHANEQAWLWVKVPAISATVDTVLYLYYNGAHPDNDAYVGDTNSAVAENVWETSAVMVQHMRDATTLTIKDSTGYDNDGVKLAVNEPIETASGKIDSAQSFDGVNDYVNCGSDVSLKLTTAISVGAWFYCTKDGSAQWIVHKGSDSPSSGYHIYREVTNYIRTRIACVGGTVVGGYPVSKDVWNRVIVTYESGIGGKIYLNGGEVVTLADKGDITWSADTVVGIGRLAVGGGYYKYNGIIDEVRIYNVAQSVEWIKADYESGRDHLLTWGAQSIMTAARAILSDLQTQWSLVDPLDAGNIHFHADWYDGKQIKPQITVTGPISSPARYFGPASAAAAGLHLLSYQRFLVNVWVRIPVGEDSTLHSRYAEMMRIEAVRILNERRAIYALPIGLVFPLDQGRPLHELDQTPRILRFEVTVQVNYKT